MDILQKSINLKDTEEVKIYEVLWRQGLLLSPDTHFPTFETKKDRISPGPEVLKGQVTSLVRRFKVRMFLVLLRAYLIDFLTSLLYIIPCLFLFDCCVLDIIVLLI